MTLPDDIFDGCVAVVGRTGSGKSYAARGIVERWLEAGRRVCVIDPTDVWYGLRSSVSGNGPGYPVVVFGGPHGDVEIGERSGERIAQLIGERNLPAIVVTAEMTSGERHRFMADFLGALYRANRSPLHLVLDEADDLAPQNPLPENRRMLGDIDRIVRRGRVRGFRPFMITQRPAVLHKNVLAMASTLVAMRLPAPQDRKAIEDWVKGQADLDEAKEMLGSLSRLQRGEGWAWAPDVGLLRREMFPAIRTFDSMRTPEHGEEVVEPSTLASVEIDELRELLSAGSPETPTGTAPDIEATRRRAFEEGMAEGRRREAVDAAERERVLRAAIDVATGYLLPHITREGDDIPVVEIRRPALPVTIDAVPRQKSTRHPKSANITCSAGGLPSAATKILAVLARGMQLTWSQAATLAGLKARGGHFSAGRKALRDGGYIVEEGNSIVASLAGIETAGGAQPKPSTPDDLLAWWNTALPQTSGRILTYLFGLGPTWIAKEQLGDALGLAPRGGHWNGAVAILRQNDLIETNADQVRASASLWTRA